MKRHVRCRPRDGPRNVLVHAYHRIQPELLWVAASVDIPAILAQLLASE